MDYSKQLLTYQRKKLHTPDIQMTLMNYGVEDIKKIIPHREGFLLISRLDGMNLEEEMMIGNHIMPPETDPVFQGHFPGSPVYPGMLQVEMMGQQGLAMDYFLRAQNYEIAPDAKPLPARATRVLGANFRSPLLPESEATIVTKKLFFDNYFGILLGQILSNNKICTVALIEVCFIEGLS